MMAALCHFPCMKAIQTAKGFPWFQKTSRPQDGILTTDGHGWTQIHLPNLNPPRPRPRSRPRKFSNRRFPHFRFQFSALLLERTGVASPQHPSGKVDMKTDVLNFLSRRGRAKTGQSSTMNQQ
jgi:hypothetical protein